MKVIRTTIEYRRNDEGMEVEVEKEVEVDIEEHLSDANRKVIQFLTRHNMPTAP